MKSLMKIKKIIQSQKGAAAGVVIGLAGIIALSGINVSVMSIGDFPQKAPEKNLESTQKNTEAMSPDMFFNRSGYTGNTKTSSTSGSAGEDPFVSGMYTGCLGYWNIWIPEANFNRVGDEIKGYMVLAHDDFVVKQHFSGKVVLDIKGPRESDYRHVKVDLFGTNVEYLQTSPSFDDRMKNKLDTFIRQIHYSAFSQDNDDGIVVLLGRVNYSGLDRDFPAYYYNLYGNFILTKL